jgi:hypothetical protein
MPASSERREFQRLRLNPPVAGTFGDAGVTVVDVGVLGARIGHAAPLNAVDDELRFTDDGKEITLRCEVVRTMNSAPPGLQSGIRFVAALGESGDHLRSMLARLVSAELEGRRDQTLAGIDHTIDGDRTVRGVDAAFMSYQLESGVWRRRRVLIPEQPASGFTVARTEDTEEMQRLCRVFQASDDEGRRLIRLFAELSVSELLNVPPQGERVAGSV